MYQISDLMAILANINIDGDTPPKVIEQNKRAVSLALVLLKPYWIDLFPEELSLFNCAGQFVSDFASSSSPKEVTYLTREEMTKFEREFDEAIRIHNRIDHLGGLSQRCCEYNSAINAYLLARQKNKKLFKQRDNCVRAYTLLDNMPEDPMGITAQLLGTQHEKIMRLLGTQRWEIQRAIHLKNYNDLEDALKDLSKGRESHTPDDIRFPKDVSSQYVELYPSIPTDQEGTKDPITSAINTITKPGPNVTTHQIAEAHEVIEKYRCFLKLDEKKQLMGEEIYINPQSNPSQFKSIRAQMINLFDFIEPYTSPNLSCPQFVCRYTNSRGWKTATPFSIYQRSDGNIVFETEGEPRLLLQSSNGASQVPYNGAEMGRDDDSEACLTLYGSKKQVENAINTLNILTAFACNPNLAEVAFECPQEALRLRLSRKEFPLVPDNTGNNKTNIDDFIPQV